MSNDMHADRPIVMMKYLQIHCQTQSPWLQVMIKAALANSASSLSKTGEPSPCHVDFEVPIISEQVHTTIYRHLVKEN